MSYLDLFDSLPSPVLEINEEYIVSFPTGSIFENGNGRVKVTSVEMGDGDIPAVFRVVIIEGCSNYGLIGRTIQIGFDSPFHKSMFPVQDTRPEQFDMSFSDLF